MDAMRSSRKRKQPSLLPPDAPIGTLTLSKSQLFPPWNKSVHLRSDPLSRKEPFAGVHLSSSPHGSDTVQQSSECDDNVMLHVKDVCKKMKPDQEASTGDDDGAISGIQVKDLRARRVYTPQSVGGACTKENNCLDSDCGDRKIAELGFVSSLNVGHSGNARMNGEIDKLGKAFSSEGQNKEEMNSVLCLLNEYRPDYDAIGTWNNEEVEPSGDNRNGENSSQKFDDSKEELVRTTLPDADISVDFKVKEDVAKRVEAFNVKDANLPVSAEEKEEDAFRPRDNRRNGSVFKRKPGKLFKSPGSVSYKRMFPFLANMMGDDAGAPKLGQYQKDEKEVANVCLSVPSIKDKCLSAPRADTVAADHCLEDVANALHRDAFKQDPKHNNGGCTSQQFGGLNKECVLTTPPDAEICGNLEEYAGEGLFLTTDKRKDFLFKIKSVPRPHFQRKVFKTPGSFSYRRLLPFLMELTKDDSGTPKLSHHQKDDAEIYTKRFQSPLSPQSQESSIKEHKIESGPMHGTVESNALVNHILLDPANELSHGNQLKLTSSQDFTEFSMQLDAKEVVHECLSAPSINEVIENVEIGPKDKCLSDSKADLCSVTVDFHCDKNVANALHNDGFNQVQNNEPRQHNSESPPKAQNVLHINPDVSNPTIEHHSTIEKGLAIDYYERKQHVSLEKHESVRRYPPEGQSLNHTNNETSNHADDRRDDAVSLNHVHFSNVEPEASSDKVMIEKLVGHGYKAEIVSKGTAYSPMTPSTESNNKNASCVGQIRTVSESKTTLVLNRCAQIKLLKQAGSFNCKRLLPFLLNTVKDNSCPSVHDHHSKVRKCSDQMPILASESHVTPIKDSNGCVFNTEYCKGNSGTQQEAGSGDDSLNNDSSRPKPAQTPEFQSSHNSCKVFQQLDEQVVLNGDSKLEISPGPSISVHGTNLPPTPIALGPVLNEVIIREKKASPTQTQSSVSFLISSNGEKPLETDGCCQNLSQLKTVEQLRVPPIGFQKGILKRNPRGCRGLCSCLNCASFRLNAEKAFAFSRNQLLDAEEVALDLIKEISHLRNMLERSADGVNAHPVFDGNQVKETCRKALLTEQLAKDRLSQMNDDLNIHCRIPSLQHPRVRFADHVEEKGIPQG